MARVTAQEIKKTVLRTEQDMALLRIVREWNRRAVRIVVPVVTALLLSPANPFIGTSHAQEKDTILPESGIKYPGGYDLNTVGDIKGTVKGIVIPESGPVQLTLRVDKEEYIVLASPGWYWEDMDTDIHEGTEVVVHGSKSLGKDGKLYIIAQEISLTGSKKNLVFRNESGNALWGGASQSGQANRRSGIGSSSGGSGSSSGSRRSGSSSGRRQGRN